MTSACPGQWLVQILTPGLCSLLLAALQLQAGYSAEFTCKLQSTFKHCRKVVLSWLTLIYIRSFFYTNYPPPFVLLKCRLDDATFAVSSMKYKAR